MSMTTDSTMDAIVSSATTLLGALGQLDPADLPKEAKDALAWTPRHLLAHSFATRQAANALDRLAYTQDHLDRARELGDGADYAKGILGEAQDHLAFAEQERGVSQERVADAVAHLLASLLDPATGIRLVMLPREAMGALVDLLALLGGYQGGEFLLDFRLPGGRIGVPTWAPGGEIVSMHSKAR